MGRKARDGRSDPLRLPLIGSNKRGLHAGDVDPSEETRVREALGTTDAAGPCRIGRLATVDYEIEIRREPGDSTILGRAVVSIAADATAEVTVALDR